VGILFPHINDDARSKSHQIFISFYVSSYRSWMYRYYNYYDDADDDGKYLLLKLTSVFTPYQNVIKVRDLVCLWICSKISFVPERSIHFS